MVNTNELTFDLCVEPEGIGFMFQCVLCTLVYGIVYLHLENVVPDAIRVIIVREMFNYFSGLIRKKNK